MHSRYVSPLEQQHPLWSMWAWQTFARSHHRWDNSLDRMLDYYLDLADETTFGGLHWFQL